jgi:hypothetical protein
VGSRYYLAAYYARQYYDRPHPGIARINVLAGPFNRYIANIAGLYYPSSGLKFDHPFSERTTFATEGRSTGTSFSNSAAKVNA